MASRALVPGSVQDVATKRGRDLAAVISEADHVVVCDCSASMADRDAPGGRSRHQAMVDELRALQAKHPGQVLVIAFNSEARLMPGGDPLPPYGTTDLARALRLARELDQEGRAFYVISDGLPDSEREALEVARRFRNPIHAIWVGPEAGYEAAIGRRFMDELARAGGGQAGEAFLLEGMSQQVERLMLAAPASGNEESEEDER